MAVAFSGGRDSTALLHATVRAAQALGLRVVALHVHHGLMPEADAWLAHARTLCRRWAGRGWPIDFDARRLDGAPADGDSVEAWARRERYRALADMARAAGADLVLLAHHRRDQAETVLLQALRGAGPAGLAAMPARAQREGITWARPWLGQEAGAVAAYVQRYRLRHIDDGSNQDLRYARNRLRLALWPALLQAFPDAEQALAGVARRAQEADAALAELARLDLAGMGLGVADPQALPVADWLMLPAARRANLLRAWLDTRLPLGAPQALVQRLLDELPLASAGRFSAGAGWEVVLYRGRLTCEPAAVAQPVGTAQAMDLSRPGEWACAGWGGRLLVQVVARGGVAPERLRRAELRPRQGGETFQRTARSTARALKKQFQAQALPAHARGGPLVWSDGQLLFVPGLGMDARAWAVPSQPQLALHWLPG